jgi:predicted nucleotidyltransferase
MATATPLPLTLNDDQRRRLAELGVVLCYAHGSVVQGRAMRESDLDIAVLLKQIPEPGDAITLMSNIGRVFEIFVPGRDVDVAFLNEAGPLFKQVVAVEGLLLFARTEDDRIRFEVHAMHEYEATRCMRDIGYRALRAHYAAL